MKKVTTEVKKDPRLCDSHPTLFLGTNVSWWLGNLFSQKRESIFMLRTQIQNVHFLIFKDKSHRTRHKIRISFDLSAAWL